MKTLHGIVSMVLVFACPLRHPFHSQIPPAGLCLDAFGGAICSISCWGCQV